METSTLAAPMSMNKEFLNRKPQQTLAPLKYKDAVPQSFVFLGQRPHKFSIQINYCLNFLSHHFYALLHLFFQPYFHLLLKTANIYVFKFKNLNFLCDQFNFKKLEDIPNSFFHLSKLELYSL